MLNVDYSLMQDKVVAVALSGGADSVALLHSIYSNKNKYNITLKAIHIEHGIRGDESIQDKDYCVSLCAKLSIPLSVISRAVSDYRAMGDTLEQSARNMRYSEFDRLLAQGYCDLIATAHHSYDNSETVLMRIFRGTGIGGLGGITPTRGKYIRPMLSVSRTEILAYLEENGLNYCTDSTNKDNAYTRNFIRNELLPTIRERYPQVDNAIYRLSTSARTDEEYIRNVAKTYVKTYPLATTVSLGAPLPVFTRAIRIAFENLGVFADVEDRHIDILWEQYTSDNKRILDMPYLVKSAREDAGLTIYRDNNTVVSPTVIYEVGEYSFGDSVVILSDKMPNTLGKVLRINANLLTSGITLRTREEGDTFAKFGTGAKKLKDYMIDEKIPRRIRDSIPLLAKDKEILCVVGYEISSQARVEYSDNCIYVYVK